MNISEMIAILEREKERLGDVPVGIVYDGYVYDIDGQYILPGQCEDFREGKISLLICHNDDYKEEYGVDDD